MAVEEPDPQITVYVDSSRIDGDLDGCRGQVGCAQRVAPGVGGKRQPDGRPAEDGEARGQLGTGPAPERHECKPGGGQETSTALRRREARHPAVAPAEGDRPRVAVRGALGWRAIRPAGPWEPSARAACLRDG